MRKLIKVFLGVIVLLVIALLFFNQYFNPPVPESLQETQEIIITDMNGQEQNTSIPPTVQTPPATELPQTMPSDSLSLTSLEDLENAGNPPPMLGNMTIRENTQSPYPVQNKTQAQVQEPVQHVQQVQQTQAAQPIQQVQKVQQVQQPVAQKPVQVAPSTPAKKPVEVSQPVAQKPASSSKPTTTTKTTIAPPPAKVEVPKAQTSTASKGSAKSSGKVWIQVGAFGAKDNADRLIREMRSAGYATDMEVVSVNGKNFHRVYIGPIDEAKVDTTISQLSAKGVQGRRANR